MSRATELVIPLFGLRCGSCALRTRRKLEALPGVANASVSVPRERAVVSYDRQHTSPAEIMAVLERSGLDARIARVRLILLDARFALASPRSLRKALCREKGVVAAAVDLTSEQAIVDYIPDETGPERITAAMRRAGFELDVAKNGSARAVGPWLAITIVSLLFALAGTVLSLRIGAIDWPAGITRATSGGLARAIPLLDTFPATSLDILTVLLAVLTLAISARAIFVKAWRSLMARRIDANSATAISMLTLTLAAVVRLVQQSPSAGLGTAAMWVLAILQAGKLLQGRLKPRRRVADPEPIECARPLSNAEQRAETLASIAAPLALIAAASAAGVWLSVGTSHALTAIMVFASVLVAVSATSIQLAVAAAIRAAMEKAASIGVRFLSGSSMEKLRDASDIVVLDSALQAPMVVTDFVLVEGTTVDELLRTAMSVGPVSDIVGIDAVIARGAALHPYELRRVERHEPGIAVVILESAKVTVGKPGAIRSLRIDTTAVDDEIASYSSRGRSPIVVAVGDRVIGAIIVGRDVSHATRDTMQKLRARGHAVWLATREEPEVAKALVDLLGLDGVMSQPDRSKWWQELRRIGRHGGRLAVVGDPAADEDLFVKASRSFAIGRGESGADARIVTGGIDGVVDALDMAEQGMRRAATNLRFALIYNVAAAVIAAGALVPLIGVLPSPPLAAAAMVAATLAIEWNGARMRRVTSPD